jgi:hypothetical protein
MMKCPKCGSEKTPKQIHEELQSWDKLTGNEEYDQGYVLGFRMALKWMLDLKLKDGEKSVH